MPAGQSVAFDERDGSVAFDERDAALVAALDAVLPRFARMLRHAVTQDQGPERLTMPQLRLLQELAACDGGAALTTRLARRMDVTVPTMTSRIDGLVERGFVQRRPDPRDRRQVHLVLTPAGRTHLVRYQALMHARLRALLSRLTPAQKERLALALQDLTALLKAGAQEDDT